MYRDGEYDFLLACKIVKSADSSSVCIQRWRSQWCRCDPFFQVTFAWREAQARSFVLEDAIGKRPKRGATNRLSRGQKTKKCNRNERMWYRYTLIIMNTITKMLKLCRDGLLKIYKMFSHLMQSSTNLKRMLSSICLEVDIKLRLFDIILS